MSLVCWVPLIGNTDQQGLSSITMSGSPNSWVDGKLGKCPHFVGSTSNVIYNNTTDFNYTDNFSYCCWLKQNFNSGAQYAFTVGRADAGGYGYGIAIASATQITTIFGTRRVAVACAANEWHHVAVTVGDGKVKSYVDGSLVNTSDVATVPTYSDGNGLGLGCFHYSGNIYPYYGDLQDFRIYDHCLSALEVKQISQALILHYPMTGGGRGCANLVPGQAKYTSVSPRVLTTTATDGNSWLSGSAFEIKPSTTYTFSVCCDGQIATKHATDGSEPGTFSMWLYLCNDGTTKNWQSGAYDSPICFTSSNYNHMQVGNRHIWQYTTTATQRYMSIRLNNYGPGTVTNRYWEFKIEESPSFTPYLPNVNESEYTTMKYNNNTEYDTSGYLRNGTINGSVSYSSDTARYSVSTEFSKAGYINVPSFNVDTSAFTLNFWVKMKTATSQHFVLGTFSSWTGNGIGVYRDANAEWYSCLIRSAGESSYRNFLLYPTVGSWHMLTLTYDGTNYKGYLNGVLKQNVTYGSGGVVSNPVFMVGNSKFNGTPASENEEAFVSDVRFYATALSAEDIQKLYNTSASLANNGTLMAYEFTEV